MKTKLTLIIALAGCFLCRNIFALTGAIYTTNVACNGVDLNNDLFASGEYRCHLAKVHTRRAIAKAKASAK